MRVVTVLPGSDPDVVAELKAIGLHPHVEHVRTRGRWGVTAVSWNVSVIESEVADAMRRLAALGLVQDE